MRLAQLHSQHFTFAFGKTRRCSVLDKTYLVLVVHGNRYVKNRRIKRPVFGEIRSLPKRQTQALKHLRRWVVGDGEADRIRLAVFGNGEGGFGRDFVITRACGRDAVRAVGITGRRQCQRKPAGGRRIGNMKRQHFDVVLAEGERPGGRPADSRLGGIIQNNVNARIGRNLPCSRKNIARGEGYLQSLVTRVSVVIIGGNGKGGAACTRCNRKSLGGRVVCRGSNGGNRVGGLGRAAERQLQDHLRRRVLRQREIHLLRRTALDCLYRLGRLRKADGKQVVGRNRNRMNGGAGNCPARRRRAAQREGRGLVPGLDIVIVRRRNGQSDTLRAGGNRKCVVRIAVNRGAARGSRRHGNGNVTRLTAQRQRKHDVRFKRLFYVHGNACRRAVLNSRRGIGCKRNHVAVGGNRYLVGRIPQNPIRRQRLLARNRESNLLLILGICIGGNINENGFGRAGRAPRDGQRQALADAVILRQPVSDAAPFDVEAEITRHRVRYHNRDRNRSRATRGFANRCANACKAHHRRRERRRLHLRVSARHRIRNGDVKEARGRCRD